MNPAPIEASDVLNGYAEIATYLRITVRQAKHRVAIGAIPVFKVGRSVSARKSSILASIARSELVGRKSSTSGELSKVY